MILTILYDLDLKINIWEWWNMKYAITCSFGGFGLSYFILYKPNNWFTKILKLIHNLGGGIKWRQFFFWINPLDCYGLIIDYLVSWKWRVFEGFFLCIFDIFFLVFMMVRFFNFGLVLFCLVLYFLWKILLVILSFVWTFVFVFSFGMLCFERFCYYNLFLIFFKM